MPTQIASDGFNRADGGLGANWTATKDFFGTTAVLQIVSNQAAGDAGGNWPLSIWTADSFPDDQYCQATYAGGTTFVTVFVRAAANGSNHLTGYGFYFRLSDHAWGLDRFNGDSTATHLQSGIGSFSAGDVLRIEAVGTEISAFINGAPFASGTDSTYTSGSAGLGITGSDAQADDWSAGSMAAGGGGKPWYAQYGMTRQFRREQRRKEQLIERARRETILRAA